MLKLVLFLLLPSLAMSKGFNLPVRVNQNASGKMDRAPVMRIAKNGTIYAAYFEAPADIYFTRSTDGGATFSTATLASDGKATSPWTSGLQRAPQFVIDSKGVVHLVWVENRVGNQADVFYIRSSDDGASWTPVISLSGADDSSKYSQDFSAITIDSSDNVSVIFLDDREQRRKQGTTHQLYMTQSSDGGMTWTRERKINVMPGGMGGTCDCCAMDIQASNDGDLYIAFRTNIMNRRDIYVTKSLDRGATWTEATPIQSSSWTLTACPATGARIALDTRENLHVVWTDGRQGGGGDKVYYSIWPAGSDRPMEEIALTETDEGPDWPSIAVSQNGIVGVAYSRSLSGVLMYKISADGGNTWSQSVALSTAKTSQLAALQYDAQNRLNAMWEDGSRDMADVYYSLDPVTHTPTRIDPVEQLAPMTDDVKSGSVTFRWSSPVNLSEAPMVWYDLFIDGPDPKVIIGLTDTTYTQDKFDLGGNYNWRVNARSAINSAISAEASFAYAVASVVEQPEQIDIYPNPVNARGELRTSSEITSLEFCDMLGRVVHRSTSVNGSIKVPQLISGVYVVVAHSSAGTRTSRLVVR